MRAAGSSGRTPGACGGASTSRPPSSPARRSSSSTSRRPASTPRSRIALWEAIEALTAEGTTVLLTTQYLDEADRLADRIAVLDNGRVIAEGTSDELKAQVGGDRLEIQLDDPAESAAASTALAADCRRRAVGRGLDRARPLRRRRGAIADAVRALTRRASASSTSASAGRRSTTCS